MCDNIKFIHTPYLKMQSLKYTKLLTVWESHLREHRLIMIQNKVLRRMSEVFFSLLNYIQRAEIVTHWMYVV